MNSTSHEVIIFIDGSSRGNPGPGGFGAIIIFPSQNDEKYDLRFKIYELGGREERTTNNRMELTAAIEALSFIHKSKIIHPKSILIYSDSSYLINGITRWVHGWQKNGWKTKEKKDVENRDLWEKLIEISGNKEIEWKQVTGHAGVAGNMRCDEIATAFADGEIPKLYSGILKNYSIKNVLEVPRGLTSHRLHREFAKSPRSPGHFASQNVLRERGRTSSQKKRSRTRAYSYVSMVDGVVQTHETWGECERRVKGKRGAKYTKVFSPEEEHALIAEWQKE